MLTVMRFVFLPTVVASGYFGYVGYHQFYLGVLGLHVVAFGLLVVAALNVLVGAGVLLRVWSASTPEDDQLGRNMQCPIKEYEERIVNGVAHRRHKNSKRQIYTLQ
jgi:hypothetical protein